MAATGEPCLVVFARAPIAGQVKTRLCRSGPGEPAALTEQQAATLHAAFVTDVCHSGARSGIPRRRLYVAGDLSHPHLVQIAHETGFTLQAQQGPDLGARMDSAITSELHSEATAVVLLGTDSPTLPTAYLQHAASLLSGPADIVLGPASDGGYYLIGACRPIPELFTTMQWGTAHVLSQTLQRLRQQVETGSHVALLPFFYDVDTPSDLQLLACHLGLYDSAAGSKADDSGSAPQAPATLAVLKDLGWL